MTNPRSDLLCWMDLEMTGLDPSTNVIVEIATLLTDANLEIVAEGPQIVIHADEGALAKMIPIVRDMHLKSGLTELIRRSTVNIADAERETLAFLKEWCQPKKIPLCGNSIWCDRMFLKLQMPGIDDFLHYRTIDVSSFKEVATRWSVHAISGAPRKGDQHRALDDIKESIQELTHYRNHWLAPWRAPGHDKQKPGATEPTEPVAKDPSGDAAS